MTAVSSPSATQIVSRVAASLLGGWLFVWGFATLGIALALAAGMLYGEAIKLFYLLAFPLFLFMFCWTFAVASLARAWTVLAGGGAVMTAIAWALTR